MMMRLLPHVSTMILFNFLVGSSYSLMLTNPKNPLSWHALRRKTTFQIHSTRPQSGYDTSAEYERFLSSKKKKKKTRRRMALWKESQKSKEEDEDGYAAMMKRRQSWKSTVILPFANRIANFLLSPTSSIYGTSSNNNREVGKLILIRHGESEWNKNKTFTGWADPDLSQQGCREVEYAARLLLEGGYNIDVVFTSRLQRAIRSTWILLGEINQLFLPVFKSWRLNERNYGALTGLCKMETAQRLGVQLVQSWRGSLKSRPPPLDPLTSVYWPGNDRRYSDLSEHQIPKTESLMDCMERTRPLWEDKISYELRMGRNVLVVAHANTLRGLVKIIDNIGDEDIQQVSIPTGIPIVYKFQTNSGSSSPLRPKPPSDTALSQTHMSGIFLEKPGMLKEALKREKEWIENVPGYSESMNRSKTPMSALERSLSKLAAEKELKNWAGQFVDYQKLSQEDDGTDGGHMGNLLQSNVIINKLLQSNHDKEFIRNITSTTAASPNMITRNDLCVVSPPQGATSGNPTPDANGKTKSTTGDSVAGSVSTGATAPIRRDPIIVLIRHGKTEHNKLGLFTGWQDAPLASEGREEAKRAGQLLKLHGFEFDVVYTSWLSRAIETAWLVMDSMDCVWLPLVKTWRLNERMYGALTGHSKSMIAQQYGEKQFKAWRRGYTVRPPKVSSFSLDYPGNDRRYKYIYDLRYSMGESIMRSFDSGKLELHRKLPKTESLKDCMSRVIPYFCDEIQPRVEEGKRVLISSSENAIRGLLMHLCEIPEEKISELEIPNGLPLIYDVKSKCIKLLDDGSGINPLEVYKFGKAASFLFRPCQNADGSEDEECDIRFMSDEMWKYLSEQEEKRKDSTKMLRPKALSETQT